MPRVTLKNRAGLIMKNWQRQLLHPLRLLGRGFRPSAGSESAYDFRKEDLIPFAVPARIKIIHLQSALVGKPMDETYNDRPIPVCRGE